MIALWTAVALLLVALVIMRVAGGRALRSWGVAPSPAVRALGVANTAAIVAVVAFAFWKYVN